MKQNFQSFQHVSLRRYFKGDIFIPHPESIRGYFQNFIRVPPYYLDRVLIYYALPYNQSNHTRGISKEPEAHRYLYLIPQHREFLGPISASIFRGKDRMRARDLASYAGKRDRD